MLVTNVVEYFQNCQLRESRVLAFRFSASTRQIQLVADYAADVVSQWFEERLAGKHPDEIVPLPSDFRRFIFSDVEWLAPPTTGPVDARQPPVAQSSVGDWIDLASGDKRRSPIITDFGVTGADDGYTASLVLEMGGTSRYRFHFANLEAVTRKGRALTKEGGELHFEDIDDHRVFKFSDPFGQE
jgi:hypothetical protein